MDPHARYQPLPSKQGNEHGPLDGSAKPMRVANFHFSINGLMYRGTGGKGEEARDRGDHGHHGHHGSTLGVETKC